MPNDNGETILKFSDFFLSFDLPTSEKNIKSNSIFVKKKYEKNENKACFELKIISFILLIFFCCFPFIMIFFSRSVLHHQYK